MKNIEGLSSPLHILLRNPSARRTLQPVTQHVFSVNTPTSCFVNIGEGLMVSTPEFCFLQLAARLPLAKLIELGYELCGTYSMSSISVPFDVPSVIPIVESEMPALIDLRALGQKRYAAPSAVSAEESKPAGQGFNTRLPLTSTKKLKAFLTGMPGVKGHKKAVRALRYIADSSASPMETRLAIILALSHKLGGYHFPLPEHNSRIVPVKAARKNSDKTYYACDMFWPDYSLAVEYDSDVYHTGPERIAEDSKRRNALAFMGVTVITVTNKQIHSISELEKVARVLAGRMGKKLRLTNPGFADAHLELRKLLM